MCLFSQTPKILLCRRDKGSYLVETEQTSLGWGVSLDFDEKNMVWGCALQVASAVFQHELDILM